MVHYDGLVSGALLRVIVLHLCSVENRTVRPAAL